MRGNMSNTENTKDIKEELKEENKDKQSSQQETENVQQPGNEETAAENEKSDNDCEKKIAELEAQVRELKENYLRQVAENQNSRKRLVKQHQDAQKYRHQDILKDLADVIDNFERAIDSASESRDFDSFHEGILMIEKQFSGMLTERYGLQKIGAEGEPFDPASHEALMFEESEEVETETVKQVLQTGYKLFDRIIRPAKVSVLKPAAKNINIENNDSAGNGE